MRLGRYPASDRRQFGGKVYGSTEFSERHRHRYEVNNDLREALSKHGLLFSGLSPDQRLVEMIELPDHPFFVACQFHPELKSRPDNAHPLFVGFVEAMITESERRAIATGKENPKPEIASNSGAISGKSSAKNSPKTSCKASNN
jgi:CTP synthase